MTGQTNTTPQPENAEQRPTVKQSLTVGEIAEIRKMAEAARDAELTPFYLSPGGPPVNNRMLAMRRLDLKLHPSKVVEILDRLERAEDERKKARAERDALSARLAVVTGALAPFGEFSRVLHHNDRRQVPDDAVEAQSFGDDVANLTRGDFRAAVAALTDNPARAAALLRVVEAARILMDGDGTDSDYGLAVALRALDGEAHHG
ncbi:MAG: hypothetical protein RLZZ501_2191 [Pseudomonadota bacterium]|jgi:hypothetical protein